MPTRRQHERRFVVTIKPDEDYAAAKHSYQRSIVAFTPEEAKEKAKPSMKEGYHISDVTEEVSS